MLCLSLRDQVEYYTLQCKTSQGQSIKQAWLGFNKALSASMSTQGWSSPYLDDTVYLHHSMRLMYRLNIKLPLKMKFLIAGTINSVYY